MRIILGLISILWLGCGEDASGASIDQITDAATDSDSDSATGGINDNSGDTTSENDDDNTGENGGDSASESGGDSDTLPGRWKSELEENTAAQKTWNDNKPASYEYQLENICFCPPQYTGPFKVTVKDNQIVSAFRAEVDVDTLIPTGNWVPVDESEDASIDVDLSIEGLFDRIKDLLEFNAYRATIAYDATWGFPAAADFDIDEMSVDEEWSATITNFEVFE